MNWTRKRNRGSKKRFVKVATLLESINHTLKNIESQPKEKSLSYGTQLGLARVTYIGTVLSVFFSLFAIYLTCQSMKQQDELNKLNDIINAPAIEISDFYVDTSSINKKYFSQYIFLKNSGNRYLTNFSAQVFLFDPGVIPMKLIAPYNTNQINYEYKKILPKEPKTINFTWYYESNEPDKPQNTYFVLIYKYNDDLTKTLILDTVYKRNKYKNGQKIDIQFDELITLKKSFENHIWE